jgi:hypothetical protein
LEVFCERGITYGSKDNRTANSVKGIFGLFAEIPYLVGTLELQKVNEPIG